MKISRLEKVSLAVTAAFLLLTTGYFLGVRSTAVPYRIDTQYAAEDTLESAAPETAAPALPSKPPAGSNPPEPMASESAPAEPQAAAPPAPSVSAAARVNINTADAAELATLPGIGEKKAAAIVADRAENGPFRIPENLTRVKGIGEKTLENLLDLITVS
ncbi:MAG: ComEA family DNA-binding protein [Intestinimonas sp.]|jgi:competence ComEA-like helix-hairpin-helix protein|nr:ComEA family DNA-binding protein [Intestinimonas sp.]